MKHTVVLWFALLLPLLGCKSDTKYQLVSEQYNFSVQLPESPTITKDINDEGLPSSEWVVKHTHLTDADYYDVRATCYKEVLKPDDELTGDSDPTLILNGITIISSRRFMMKAKETDRDIPAYARTSKEKDGGMMSSIFAVDGKCMISVGTRINPSTAGDSAMFLGSFEFLK